MDSKWGRWNFAHAVFCALALGSGITYSVLSAILLNFIYNRFERGSSAAARITTTLLWMIGLAYIVPAVVGLIAAGLRKKTSYTVHMILSFVAIGILAYLFIRGLASGGFRGSGNRGFCSMDSRGTCTCENSVLESLLEYFTCDEINRIVRTGISIDAMFFGGGVITVIAAVFSGILSNKVQQRPQSQPTYSDVQGSEVKYPGHGIQYSGQGIQYSGQGIQYPGQGIQYPGQGIQYPGQGIYYSGQGIQYPGNEIQKPEQGIKYP